VTRDGYDFTYLSLGAGVQSSALLVCSALGLHGVPKADVAIFADTDDEPQYVYAFLETLKAWSPIEIRITSKGKLSEWVVGRQRAGKRFVTVPLHTSDTNGDRGMLRRQCTREFKLEPIHKEVRRLLGVEPRHKIRQRVRAMIGISVDEVQRMKPSRQRWITNTWPLVDAGLSREACKRIVREAGLPEPERSACVYCPYHSDSEWHRLKTEHPADFGKAVEFDAAVRDMTMRGLHQPAFVHRSLKPLNEVEFDSHGAAGQGDLFTNECEGMCGL
jgi:hypothetical protein